MGADGTATQRTVSAVWTELGDTDSNRRAIRIPYNNVKNKIAVQLAPFTVYARWRRTSKAFRHVGFQDETAKDRRQRERNVAFSSQGDVTISCITRFALYHWLNNEDLSDKSQLRRRWTRATCCFTPIALYTKVDGRWLKLAFYDADTDTDTDILADILAKIVARMSACRSACQKNNFRKSRVSDMSARILARMSVSVSASASWNASFNQRPSSVDCRKGAKWVSGLGGNSES